MVRERHSSTRLPGSSEMEMPNQNQFRNHSLPFASSKANALGYRKAVLSFKKLLSKEVQQNGKKIL